MFSPVVTQGGFKFIEQYPIEVLGVQVQYFEHQKTGAKHYHFACDDHNKTFMVALRTLPMNSTGVAHILEHLVLCGSSRYPVRDPFFLMIRRSLSNFMNAFTSSDWTAYPFSTQNNKDFHNLLQVYLDAVFFPKLEELDFKQEGWRLHIDSPGELAQLDYKGVVFNEMKGAMGSPTRQLWHHVCRHLFSSESTYHYNSGGEPLDIPLLTHQQLLDFYQCYYHPSNAVFFSYGNLDVAVLQGNIESAVLYAFEKRVNIPTVAIDRHFAQPKTAVAHYPVSEKEQASSTHIVLAWRLDFDSMTIADVLQANLLNLLLFDNAASPMQKLLEESDLGTSPSMINGLEDDMKEMVLVIGLEGCEKGNQDKVSRLIMDELQRLCQEGIEAQQVEACMHQLELAQRDISGGSMPTGLNLILSVISPAIHEAAIGDHLNIDKPLAELRQQSEDPEFIKGLFLRLCANPNRLCLEMSPDIHLNTENLKKEQQQLAHWKQQLDIAQQKALQKENTALEKRQLEPQNAEILPTIGIDDIHPSSEFVNADESKKHYSYYQTRCNGLVYVNAVMQLPSLSQQQSVDLPLLSSLLSEVGSQEVSYLNVQQAISRYTGGISIKPSFWQPLEHLSKQSDLRLRLVVSSMSLSDNVQELFALMSETINRPRFDEKHHIKEHINQIVQSAFYGVDSHGHLLAMQAASSYFSVSSTMGLEWSGLAAVSRLLALKQDIKDDAKYEQWISKIQQLYQHVSDKWQSQWLLVSDEVNKTELLKAFSDQIMPVENTLSDMGLSDRMTMPHSKSVWSIESEVNYCALAYVTQEMTHPDSATLHILANYLRNVYLHTAIREQGGAYGGGCHYDALSGIFRFFSYRDPRLHETFEDFHQAIKNVLKHKIKPRDIQEAIFNAIAKIDAPASPPDTVKQDFYASLNGIDKAFREDYKRNLLRVSANDMVRVVHDYFIDKPFSQAVITGHNQAEELHKSYAYHPTILKI